MKILLVSDTFPPDVNGAAYFTYRLGHSLASRGHEVHVAAPGLAWRDAESRMDGMVVHRIRSLPTPFHSYFRFCPSWAARSGIMKILAEVQPDVVHVQNHILLGRAAVIASRERNIPLVGTNHFMPQNLVHFFPVPKQLERRAVEWAWRQFCQVYQHVDLVTTPTKTAADLLRGVGFQKEAQPISCGIDLNRFHPGISSERMRVRFGIDRDAPVVLYVGRLEAEKNLPVVLEAFAKFISQLPEARLVLVGMGTQREVLEQAAVRLGIQDAVIFTGFAADDDMPEIFAMGTLFVMASVAELQSIATMEAMATGLPITAANVLALPELVHDDVNGYTFPPRDPHALAERLARILLDAGRRKDMGAASLQLIQRHGSEMTARAFEDVYRRAIGLHL